MLYREWLDLNLPVKWSIWADGNDYDHKMVEDWELDITTDAPDGAHEAIYTPLGKQCRVDGIIVKDGKFVPEPTAHALYDLILQSDKDPPFNRKPGDPLCHEYIERMIWDGKRFEVLTGS